jgi:tetratricopeptide (TPR) repeat protein
MSHTESKELTQAKKLIDEGKYDEVLQLIDSLEQMKSLTLQDKVSCRLLKCNLLFWQWKFEEMLKIAGQIYKESLELGRNLQSVDALILSAKALKFLQREEEAINVINQAEELLKTYTQELPEDYMQREAHIYIVKGMRSPSTSYKVDDQLKFLEQSLVLGEKLGNKVLITESLYYIAYILGGEKGELNRAIKYLKRSLLFAEESNNKYYMAINLLFLMIFHNNKGELDRSLMYGEQGLTLCEKINNKQVIAGSLTQIGNVYRGKGNFSRALGYLERGLALREDLGINLHTSTTLTNLIGAAVEMGDLELAQKYFNRLKQINEQEESKWINSCFRFSNAILLKTSTRAKNRVKAEEIFKEIIEEEGVLYKIEALLELCDLLLVELRITNDAEVLKEIKIHLNRILEFSEKTNSFLFLAETYLLQAKVALITFDTNEARRFLTRAQEVAEKYGLNLIAMKISNEHDELLKQLEMWENLKESKAPLAERMELSRLNDQMEGMVKRRVGKIPKLKAEQPVLLTVMSKEGNTILSNPFTADVKIDNAYFSDFLSSCTTFCDQILSESFDRVKFGQHTVLITAVDSFSICYMFQGQSYSARQKLIHFSEAVKKEADIMKILEDASIKNIEIKVNETASLEELIYESFLSDPQQFQMPFEAYKGDGPFVFVSYSHTDRLQVYPIIDYLNRTGINIWYDEGIPISEDWKESIVENLERCSAFVVFITPHIIDSEYVRKEISFALKKQKPFFSVYLKETQLPSKLEFEIGDIQFMNKYLMPETEFYIKLNKMLDPVLIK